MLQPGDALLIVDPQNDFMPGGALAVPEGDRIIPIVNAWIVSAQQLSIPIIISRDWHPPHHISFKERGGPWPEHCVQNTFGAAFHKDIVIPENAIIINKAFLIDKDAYSAFEGITTDTQTPLPEKLHTLGIKRIWIAGLALDYCVYHSAISAHNLGFEFHVILPACRAIAKDSAQKALADMQQLGVMIEYGAPS
ncbi:MAG TPA: nicotinamidase [Gammaproteobacteria bacterium]|nr:nicotinamidase [Gammaproteobacteria bacterium]